VKQEFKYFIKQPSYSSN